METTALKLTDFNAGSPAYVIDQYGAQKGDVKKVTVLKVGRKYVTTDCHYPSKFKKGPMKTCLIGHEECGVLLFLSYEDATRFIMIKNAYRRIRKVDSYKGISDNAILAMDAILRQDYELAQAYLNIILESKRRRPQ